MIDDWESNSFIVMDIMISKLGNVQLSYLSSYNSVHNQIELFWDERFHIAETFLADFRFIMGTLWHINDKHSMKINANFYRDIIQNSRNIDTRRVTQSLRMTVRQLRVETRHVKGFSHLLPDDHLIWAPFVHMSG